MGTRISEQEGLTHFDQQGHARMVDVGAKPDSVREAVATGVISMSDRAYQLVRDGRMAKGDVLGVARIAAIMAAKKVDELIPLAHPLAITRTDIQFEFDELQRTITIEATIGTTGKTGVEMEALTAVSVAALTIYDMCKAVDKGMEIKQIRLVSKKGGKSGTYQRQEGHAEK